MRILIVKLFPTAELFPCVADRASIAAGIWSQNDWVVHEQGAELVACFDDVNRVIVYPEDELKHVNRRNFPKRTTSRYL